MSLVRKSERKVIVTMLLVVSLMIACFAHTTVAYAAMSDSEIVSLIETSIGDNFDGIDYTLNAYNGSVVMKVSMGQDRDTMELGRDVPKIKESWNSLCDNMISVTGTGAELLETLGLEKASFMIMVVGDVNALGTDVYMTAINGVKLIDFYA